MEKLDKEALNKVYLYTLVSFSIIILFVLINAPFN